MYPSVALQSKRQHILILDILLSETISEDANRSGEEERMDVDTVSSCSKCNLYFMTQAEFMAHKKRRACSRKFSCQSCGKMFNSVKLLVSHLVEAQHGETICSVCNFAVDHHHEDMEIHIKRHALDLSKVITSNI